MMLIAVLPRCTKNRVQLLGQDVPRSLAIIGQQFCTVLKIKHTKDMRMLIHDIVGPLVNPLFLVTDFEWTVTDQSYALKYAYCGELVYIVTASYTLHEAVIDIVGRTLEAERVERLISTGHWDENYGLYNHKHYQNCWRVKNHEAVGIIRLQDQMLSFESFGLALNNRSINLADPDSGIEEFINSLQMIVRQRRTIICSNTKDMLILNA